MKRYWLMLGIRIYEGTDMWSCNVLGGMEIAGRDGREVPGEGFRYSSGLGFRVIWGGNMEFPDFPECTDVELEAWGGGFRCFEDSGMDVQF